MKDTITLPREVVKQCLVALETNRLFLAVESLKTALDAPAPTAEPQPPILTKAQAKQIMGMALDLEKTGRIVSLSEGQDRSDYVARNRNIQCALEDYLRNLTEPPAHGIKEGS